MCTVDERENGIENLLLDYLGVIVAAVVLDFYRMCQLDIIHSISCVSA